LANVFDEAAHDETDADIVSIVRLELAEDRLRAPAPRADGVSELGHLDDLLRRARGHVVADASYEDISAYI